MKNNYGHSPAELCEGCHELNRDCLCDTNAGTWKVQESNQDTLEGEAEWTDTKLPTFTDEEEAGEAAWNHYMTQTDTEHKLKASTLCTCQDCAEGWRVQDFHVMSFGCRVVQVCPDCGVAVPADDNGEPIHPDNNCFYATV